MKSASGIIGVILTWLASWDWCYWAWINGGPPVFFIPLSVVGGVLVIVAAVRTASKKPVAAALAALIPPFVILAMRGFRI
jgi:hypothetical protein